MFEQLLQPAISGLLAGGVYALPAAGLMLVWGVMKIVNIAHGVLALLAAYLALTLFLSLGVDPLAGLVLLVPLFFAVGVALQRGLIQPVTGQPEIRTLMVLFAFTIVAENVITRVWSADFRALSPAYAARSLEIADLNLSVARGVAFLLALVTVFGLHAVLQRTYFGKAIRATAQNPAGRWSQCAAAPPFGPTCFPTSSTPNCRWTTSAHRATDASSPPFLDSSMTPAPADSSPSIRADAIRRLYHASAVLVCLRKHLHGCSYEVANCVLPHQAYGAALEGRRHTDQGPQGDKTLV